MDNVIPLREAMATILARELGVSSAFIERCRSIGIAANDALAVIAWFEALSASERIVVAGVAAKRTRA